MDNENQMSGSDTCPVCSKPVTPEEKEGHAREHEAGGGMGSPPAPEGESTPPTANTTAAGLGEEPSGVPAPTVPDSTPPETTPTPTPTPPAEPETPPAPPASPTPPTTPPETTPTPTPNV